MGRGVIDRGTISALGTDHELVDGQLVPTRIEISSSSPTSPVLRIMVELIDGHWEQTQIILTPRAGERGISREDRALVGKREIDALINLAIWQTVPSPTPAYRQSVARRGRERISITNEHLENVARVYVAAEEYPRKAVMKHFGVSAATASRYIAEAREKLPDAFESTRNGS